MQQEQKVPLEITHKALILDPAELPVSKLHLLKLAKVENKRQIPICKEKNWACFLTQTQDFGVE